MPGEDVFGNDAMGQIKSGMNTYATAQVHQRHDNIGFNSPGKLLISDSRINAVAMTVQPDAPIDPATGEPLPAGGDDLGAPIQEPNLDGAKDGGSTEAPEIV